MRARRRGVSATVLVAAVSMVGCGDGAPDDPAPEATATDPASTADGSAAEDEKFPDVVEATASRSGNTWTFEVTISSPYDTPQRYADGWRVLGPDGEVYGEHTLAHDHAGEQPFTRTQEGVEIPDDVDEVTIEGRDLVSGYGGTTATVQLTPP